MTRINVGIHPKYLVDQHLIAEIKEIPQLLGQLTRSLACGTATNLPTRFTLGKGHVKFFYNKLSYLDNRFNVLREEANKRGFNINASIDLSAYPSWCKNDYVEQPVDEFILIDRISSKLKSKPNFYRYNKKQNIPTFIKTYYLLHKNNTL